MTTLVHEREKTIVDKQGNRNREEGVEYSEGHKIDPSKQSKSSLNLYINININKHKHKH